MTSSSAANATDTIGTHDAKKAPLQKQKEHKQLPSFVFFVFFVAD
jgi:hypothetical protein